MTNGGVVDLLAERRAQAEADQVVWRGRVRLATPMLGGGVESGKVDSTLPIRPSSIGGQLRFWWRATSGVLLPSVEAMREREDLIFGAAAVKVTGGGQSEIYGGRGLVSVRVAESKCAQPKPLLNDRNCPGYVKNILLQGVSAEDQSPTLVDQASAVVGVSLRPSPRLTNAEREKVRAEVLLAVRAWLKYGGLGARNRRGFGVLQLAPPGPPNNGISWDESVFGALALAEGDARADTPGLHGAVLFFESKASADALAAWRRAVTVYQLIRKGVRVASNGVEKTFAQRRDASPEGTNIKDLLGHGSSWVHTGWPERSFVQELENLVPDRTRRSDVPRAQFGLPYHLAFLDNHANKPKHQYDVTRIESDRFASPLFVRPILRADGWHAAILVLNVAPVTADEVQIKSNKGPGKARPDPSLYADDACFRGAPWLDEFYMAAAAKLKGTDNEMTPQEAKKVFEKQAASAGIRVADLKLYQTFIATFKVDVATYVARVVKEAGIGWRKESQL